MMGSEGIIEELIDEDQLSSEEDTETQSMRMIADMISDFRQEYIDSLHNSIVQECEEIVESGYDIALGSGRGAWWAEGC